MSHRHFFVKVDTMTGPNGEEVQLIHRWLTGKMLGAVVTDPAGSEPRHLTVPQLAFYMKSKGIEI